MRRLACLLAAASALALVSRLFGWVGSHPRVRMVLYNQGSHTDAPFRLRRYPRSKPRCARRSRTAASPSSAL